MKGAKQIGKYTLSSGITIRFFWNKKWKVTEYSLHTKPINSDSQYQLACTYAKYVSHQLDLWMWLFYANPNYKPAE